MNYNPYSVNILYKSHEQDIIRSIENGRGASTAGKTFSANHFVRRIVNQLRKRA